MTSKLHLQLKIINEKGLHARASAKLVEVAERFDARAILSHDGITASADSIMGLLMLAASKGSSVDIELHGAQAEALGEALTELVENRFGEPS